MAYAFINNTKHFAITNTSNIVQDALNAGTFENPYVALVNNNLDYNSMEPEKPCYLGKWSDDGAGHYTFQILETGDIAWENGPNIGSLADVYFNGDGPIDMDVKLDTMPGSGEWHMTFVDPNESASPNHAFEEGSSENWYCDEVTPDLDSSTANVLVSYDGVDTFVFSDGATGEAALSMNTINPECSER